MRPTRMLARGFRFLMLIAAAAACGDSPTTPTPRDESARLTVRASLAGTSIASLVIEVRAADLAVPLVFPLTIQDDIATGVLSIPAGSDRTVIGHAYDAEGIETHRGEIVIDVHAGMNGTLFLRLDPLNGSVPIIVEIGSIRVTVSPAEAGLVAGDTLRLRAVAVNVEGDTVEAEPVWASLDPGVATVSATGLVTALEPGSATIVAMWAGVGGAAEITVALSGAAPALELVTSGLARPVELRSPPGETRRLFVLEKSGTVRIVADGEVLSEPFLDLTAIVGDVGERGLLSLAFHPDYATNGWFYVVYTRMSDGAVRLERYTVSANPDRADAASAMPMVTIDHSEASNHNGGQIHFGPDGYLYWSVGDGGGGQAPNAQDTTELLGSILRLDVDGALPYAIPEDNPFVGMPGADELWAKGLRNPWRMSFDPATGELYIADVGQNRVEEVNVEPAGDPGGRNYGWNRMEGMLCFPTDPCDSTGLTLPVLTYPHGAECSITGGYVYRGPTLLALQGHYLYADYCSGRVWSFRYQGGTVQDATDWTATLSPGSQITSFGRDGAGELYVLTNGGAIYRIVPSGP